MEIVIRAHLILFYQTEPALFRIVSKLITQDVWNVLRTTNLLIQHVLNMIRIALLKIWMANALGVRTGITYLLIKPVWSKTMDATTFREFVYLVKLHSITTLNCQTASLMAVNNISWVDVKPATKPILWFTIIVNFQIVSYLQIVSVSNATQII